MTDQAVFDLIGDMSEAAMDSACDASTDLNAAMDLARDGLLTEAWREASEALEYLHSAIQSAESAVSWIRRMVNES